MQAFKILKLQLLTFRGHLFLILTNAFTVYTDHIIIKNKRLKKLQICIGEVIHLNV